MTGESFSDSSEGDRAYSEPLSTFTIFDDTSNNNSPALHFQGDLNDNSLRNKLEIHFGAESNHFSGSHETNSNISHVSENTEVGSIDLNHEESEAKWHSIPESRNYSLNMLTTRQDGTNSKIQIVFERDIEPRKENLQPLRSGRTGLQCLISVRKEERAFHIERFEQDLTKHPKDINIYIEYVHYLKKTTEDVSSDSNYISVLKRATEILSNDYKSDIRLLRLWLMYIDNVRDPLEAFRWMEANSVGTMFADFWIRWTRFIEDQNDFQGAKKILELGIERDAKPIDKLKKRMQDYFKRVVYRIKNGIVPNTEDCVPSTHQQYNSSSTVQIKEQCRQPLGIISETFEEGVQKKRKRENSEMDPEKKLRLDPLSFQIFSDSKEDQASQSNQYAGYIRGKSICAPSESKRFGLSLFSSADNPHKRALTNLPFVSLDEQSKENHQVIEKLLPSDASYLITQPVNQLHERAKPKLKPKKKGKKSLLKMNSRLKVYQDKPERDQRISDSMSRLVL